MEKLHTIAQEKSQYDYRCIATGSFWPIGISIQQKRTKLSKALQN